MGAINRTLLFFYTLFFAAVSIGVILIVAHVIPDRILLNEYQFLSNSWQTGVAAGAFFLLSIHLLLCCFDRKAEKHSSSKDIVLVQGAAGDVQVSMEAIQDMIQRHSTSVNGVREAKVKCSLVPASDDKGERIKADIRITVGQDKRISNITDEINKRVSDGIADVVGVNDFDIVISVQDIVSGVVTRKRRVI